MRTATFYETVGDVETKALVSTMYHSLAEVEAEGAVNTLCDVKANASDETLPHRPPEVKGNKVGETMTDVRAHQKFKRWLLRLQRRRPRRLAKHWAT